jgi:hypothetical protein
LLLWLLLLNKYKSKIHCSKFDKINAIMQYITKVQGPKILSSMLLLSDCITLTGWHSPRNLT